MSNVFVIRFKDFKRVINNKRLFYYVGQDSYEFCFFNEGIIIKSSILKKEVDNEKRFFSDPIFYNAIQIEFRIPGPEQNTFNVGETRVVPKVDIQKIQDDEMKNKDLQREGVEIE